VEALEVQPIVPGLLVVELLKLLRPHLELDRDHGRGCDERGIHPPAEPRDVELEVDPGGGGGGISGLGCGTGCEIGEGSAEHGQLQPPRGELLGGERVAMRARKRRVDLVVGGAEERGDRVGVEGSVETWAGLGGHDG
jgi:hypothetical protein